LESIQRDQSLLLLQEEPSHDVFTKSQGQTPKQNVSRLKKSQENNSKSLSPRIINFSHPGYKSQAEFLKFRDMKESLDLPGSL
jgi:hypothetical protein